MRKPIFDPPPLISWVIGMQQCDVLAIIPSYNAAHTVNYVVYQVAKGFSEYFPDLKAAILVSDGGSTDGTREVVRALKLPFKVSVLVEEYPGVKGKGSAVRHGFKRGVEMGARAFIMVDSDLRSIAPEWVKLLGAMVDKGYDLVTPLYARHKYDGTITKHLAYPLTRALYGVDVRQPIGGDFGLSGELVKSLLNSGLWKTEYVPRFGIDVFITNSALAQGYRVAQAELGVKVHEAKDPSKHLERMFVEVAGSQFSVAASNAESWRGVRGCREAPVLRGKGGWKSPQPVAVDVKAGVERFRAVYGEREYLIRSILGGLFDDFKAAARRVEKLEKGAFPHELWARVVYRHLSAFAGGAGNDALRSLHACWLARVLAYIVDVEDAGEEEAEAYVREGARLFEEEKEFLESEFPLGGG